MSKVTIVWGKLHPDDTDPVTYNFFSEAEKDAFLKGVDEGVGWHNWDTIGEKYSDYQTIEEYREAYEEEHG